MSKSRDLQEQLNDAGDRARRYAGDTADSANGLFERGRKAASRFSKKSGYRKQMARAAEDISDEANYQYRRARRHVNRHPVAAGTILAGAIGAGLLVWYLLKSRDED